MYIFRVWCIYSECDVYSECGVHIQSVMYIQSVVLRVHIQSVMYIRSVMYIFRVWCIYSECDVSESVLRGEHAMFCERIGKQCVSLRRNCSLTCTGLDRLWGVWLV